jgi:ATP-dependent DNA ligase
MKYLNYRYLFPPRPENAIPNSELNYHDNGSLISQVKIDGSNCVIFTNGESIHVMNRHGSRLTRFEIKDEEILSLYQGTGGWTVLNGEYLNRNKRDETGKSFNHKLILFDILVNDGDYLIGKTFEQRIQLLDEMFHKNECEKDYLFGISDNVYRVKSYENNFSMLYDTLTYNNELLEGLVLKRRNARLEIGNVEKNNTKSQIKCRKQTLNYKF